MTIGATKADVYTDFKGLAELRLNGQANPEETLRTAGRQFEAMFIQMMLKSMRDASPGDSLMGSGGQDMYQDMFDKQMSLTLSAKGALGLGEAMVRQMQQAQAAPKNIPDAAAAGMPLRPSVPAGEALPLPTRAVPAAAAPAGPRAAASHESQSGFKTPEEFVAALWPAAQASAHELGVDPRVLIAQAALETGWGRSVLQQGDGRSSHNLFNIKAGESWEGGRVNVATLEYRDGVAMKERANFRVYDSFKDSFADYVELIKSQPRYRDALANAGDPRQFVNELQRAGYATDPRYAEKIDAILRRDLLSGLPAFRAGGAESIA